jgi:putative transposase
MPARHVVKVFSPDSFYHIYSRGVEKRKVFEDEQDYSVFLGLCKRYLSPEKQADDERRVYKNFSDQIELNAFCLMPNHFHLLVYQYSERAITDLMRALLVSYSMYFNHKYRRVGGLFQSHYHASLISSDSYIQHISRYIHLNPKNYKTYRASSYAYYAGRKHANWLQTGRILELFDNNATKYLKFVDDYKDYKETLDRLKVELANH